jgi:uncharacterized membrane protein
MSTVVESVDVAVPVRTAYHQWTQFEEFPRFMAGVREIRQLDATHMHWVIDINGVRREFDAEITEQRPDERVAWCASSGARHAGVVTFHRLDANHTRVTARVDLDPGDPEGWPQVRDDMARFRDFVQARRRQRLS